MIGNWVTWYEDGTKKTVCTYSEEVQDKYGIADGEFKEWYPNTKPKTYADFKLGLLINKLQCWYESGEIAVNAQFSKDNPGVPYGQWVFFYENGKKAMNCVFSNGEMTDECEFFTEEGNSLELNGREELVRFITQFNKSAFGESRFSVLRENSIKFND